MVCYGKTNRQAKKIYRYTIVTHTHVTKMFPFHLYNRFLADGTVFKGYTFSHVD